MTGGTSRGREIRKAICGAGPASGAVAGRSRIAGPGPRLPHGRRHQAWPPPPASIELPRQATGSATTQGEVEFVGRLATKYHWHSIAVVAITPQASRARLGVGRYFAGRQVYLVTAPLTRSSWPYQIAYQWAALVKALVIQRSC